MNNVMWFVILFGASCIPWFIAFFYKSLEAQRGLLNLDAALTVASYVFLWWAIGWWTVIFTIGMIGVGRILKSLGLTGYTTIEVERERKRRARKSCSA